jgi:hypothetical protein
MPACCRIMFCYNVIAKDCEINLEDIDDVIGEEE